MAREERLAGLDLLRGFAALTVAISHFMIDRYPEQVWSETVSILAVEVFFVLSGFVLTPQIIKCATSANYSTIGIFLSRRWMRTVPPYLLALAGISLVTPEVFRADALRYAVYVQNVFFQANQVDYYTVAWSLSVEEWFYIVFPLCLVVFARLVGGYRWSVLVVATIVFILAISLLRTAFSDNLEWGYNVRRVVVFRIDSIAYGVLLWAFWGSYKATGRDVIFAACALVVSVGGCVSILSAIKEGGEVGKVLFPFGAALLGSSAVFFFRAVEGYVPPLLVGPCLFLGRISYSVYLFHLLVLMLVARLELSPLIDFLVFVVVLVCFGWTIYRLYERPFLDARPSYPDEGVGSVAAAVREAKKNVNPIYRGG